MYVGVVVFGVIAVLAILAYATLWMAGYQPPPESPFELLFPPESDGLDAGEGLFLALAVAFAVAFTVFAWRRLVAGARGDAAKRRRMAQLQRELKTYKDQRKGKGPGGYT